MTNLPTDVNSRPIQTLSPVEHQVGTVSTGAALRLVIPADTQVIRVASTVDCYMKLGDSGVTATSSDAVFPIGVEVFSKKEYTHISLLAITATGVASVSRMA